MANPDDNTKPPEEPKSSAAESPPEAKTQAGTEPSVTTPPAAATGEASPGNSADGPGAAELGTLNGPGSNGPELTSLSNLAAAPITKSTPIDEKQETTRGYIALALVGILLVIIAASFFTLWWTNLKLTDVKGLLEVILAPVVALVGSATGFYFGGKK